MNRRIALALATWGYSGFVPGAPGTAGAIVALGLAWLGVHRAGLPPWAFSVAAFLLLPLAIKASETVARQMEVEDPSIVVIDEVLGLWIALAPAAPDSPVQWIAGLALFRILDILKPLGLRRLESLPGGFGVLADDVGAGGYAMIGVALLRWGGL